MSKSMCPFILMFVGPEMRRDGLMRINGGTWTPHYTVVVRGGSYVEKHVCSCEHCERYADVVGRITLGSSNEHKTGINLGRGGGEFWGEQRHLAVETSPRAYSLP